jgi:murein DD-endopeptidase MepM/ murein hydrolase activator NlpD
MNELMEKEKNIRLVFGLPEVDDAIREVGVGGPELLPSGANMELNQTLSQLDKLLRQTKFERENLSQIHDQLLGKRDLLEHTPSIAPTNGYLSRGFGVRIDPFTGLRKPHLGIDLAADIGTPVYATAEGRVFFTGWRHGLGKLIIIDHGYGYRTHYGHLNKIKVGKGQKVNRGDVIGGVGNTGISTGPHLHYEVRYKNKPVNPKEYILSENCIFD